MSRKCTLLLALCLCGCGDSVTSPNVGAVDVVEGAPCEVIFAAAPEVADWALDAAQQWREATGCNVHLGDAGIPISLVERIVDKNGASQCGVTHRLRDDAGAILGADWIQVSSEPRCRLHARDVLHEMGHGLAPQRGHTIEGLMAPVPNGVDVIDAISLAFICGELGCSH